MQVDLNCGNRNFGIAPKIFRFCKLIKNTQAKLAGVDYKIIYMDIRGRELSQTEDSLKLFDNEKKKLCQNLTKLKLTPTKCRYQA